MKPIVLKLTWQTRTANLEGELRGEVVNDHHKQALITDLSVRGFRAEEAVPLSEPKEQSPINITSIDNMYEEDGIANLHNFLTMLNLEDQADPLRRQLVAILPEYDDAGRLQRLDCITVPACDPGSLSGGLVKLLEGAAEIIAGRKAAHDAAVKKLEESPCQVTP